ncbi:MAG: hypothetical protein ACKVU0_06735 [Saprospiraceae bacterium]
MKKPLILLSLLLFALLSYQCRQKTEEPPKVTVEPFGPTLNTAQLSSQFLQNSQLTAYFGQNSFRLLSVGYLDDNVSGKDSLQKEIVPPSRYYAVFYDYTQNKAIEVQADIEGRKELAFKQLDYQPRPSQEEFSIARDIFIAKMGLEGLVRERKVTVYAPMPPVLADSAGRRTVTVGFYSKDKSIASGIYPVDIIGQSVLAPLGRDYFPNPEIFGQDLCEIPPAGCGDVGSQTGGMVQVTISQGGQVLWTFYAVRPSHSSGYPSKGSGIEIRYANYKGKRVLYRGHLPILNVHYDQGACGPYRDWQNEEHCFKCSGVDAGNGFRFCSPDPKTFVEDLDDSGNFSGVGVYIKGQEVIFVSEMTAGWYRYVSEWRFNTNGTINPRFKFGGTQNNCTCQLHFHHAYWRFDLDVNQSWNNTVQEYEKSWFWWYNLTKTFKTEDKSYRNSPKRWKVSNTAGEYYCIQPGHHDGDGSGDAWAKGDVWAVRYYGNELEDGVSCIGCPGTTATMQDNVFLTGENILQKDVVIWYRASFDHDAQHGGGHGAEIVGPDLVPGTGFQ